MTKYRNLDWSYKPDKEALNAEASFKARKRLKRKSRKRKTKLSRHEHTCNLPGHVFYKTKAWRTLKKKVLSTYGYRCMCCGAIDTEIHVDHIIPRSRNYYLSLSFDNLQVLCKKCNLEKSNIHQTDYREKAAEEEVDMKIIREVFNAT